jgi:CrcB protein
MSVIIAAVAGSFGAWGRYLVSGSVQRRSGSSFPVGTAAVNVLGALVLGFTVRGGIISTGATTAVVGFLGGFTTFSTWVVETLRLGMVRRPSRQAMVNLVAVPLLGVAAAALGYYVRG